MRFGSISLFGRTNVGKSTLLNRLLDQDLAIVSPLPQTTRDALLGVVTRKDAQLAFIDTPGIHQPKSELGRRMNHAAREALRSTDAVLFMTSAEHLIRRVKNGEWIDPEDRALATELPDQKTKVVLAVNKVDLVRDKTRLLPLLEGLEKLHEFAAVVPMSAFTGDGVERLLEELLAVIPEGRHLYGADTLTDRPTRYFACEYVRESVLLATRGEVPHAVAVTVDSYDEEERLVRISATLHVEKSGQQAILIGNGGTKIRDIGTAARQRIEALVGRKVFLELFVRTTPRWKNAPRMLAELGYGGSTGAKEPPSAKAKKKPKTHAPRGTAENAKEQSSSSESEPRELSPSEPDAPEIPPDEPEAEAQEAQPLAKPVEESPL